MVHVVDQGRDRLADIGAVEAVPYALRKPGDDGALDLFLQVEDGIVAFQAERAAERGHVAPRRASEGCVAPAAQRERHDTANPRVQTNQVDKGIFGHPVDGEARAMASDVRHQGQRIDDVAERAGPDDKDTTHRGRHGKTRMRVECMAQTT
jgi:hypothetical protein